MPIASAMRLLGTSATLLMMSRQLCSLSCRLRSKKAAIITATANSGPIHGVIRSRSVARDDLSPPWGIMLLAVPQFVVRGIELQVCLLPTFPAMSTALGPIDSAGLERPSAADCLRIRGARTHNLKNVDLDIPHNKLVVITGPRGSGKSSLAFDTLFAEGQRQYIESLSVYARQFLNQLERPDVDSIASLPPVVCIDQRPGAANPRSTVATSTEIHDFLRLLFARLGEISCHRCGQPIRQQSIEQIEDALMALPEGTKLMLLAPLVRGRKGQHAEVFDQIRKAGQVRVRVDGVVFDLDAAPPLDGRKPHTIEAIVDRIVVREGSRSRLADSLQLAVKQSQGVVIASYLDDRGEEKW